MQHAMVVYAVGCCCSILVTKLIMRMAFWPLSLIIQYLHSYQGLMFSFSFLLEIYIPSMCKRLISPFGRQFQTTLYWWLLKKTSPFNYLRKLHPFVIHIFVFYFQLFKLIFLMFCRMYLSYTNRVRFLRDSRKTGNHPSL
jgi:hypothetical protein